MKEGILRTLSAVVHLILSHKGSFPQDSGYNTGKLVKVYLFVSRQNTGRCCAVRFKLEILWSANVHT